MVAEFSTIYIGGMAIDPAWLAPTWFLDSDSDEVGDFARDASDGASTPMDVAINLFHAVRDGYRYDPYSNSHQPEDYKASTVVHSDRNWCVPKSVLLTAAARNRSIPARLGFADVRNHLTSPKLQATLGTDLFIWHGYSEILLNDRWFRLSSAFNIELCEKFGVKVLEFDGTEDALMHPYDQSGNQHMEYVNYRGSFDDLPLDEMRADFVEFYPNWATSSTPSSDGVSGAEAAGDDAFTL